MLLTIVALITKPERIGRIQFIERKEKIFYIIDWLPQSLVGGSVSFYNQNQRIAIIQHFGVNEAHYLVYMLHAQSQCHNAIHTKHIATITHPIRSAFKFSIGRTASIIPLCLWQSAIVRNLLSYAVHKVRTCKNYPNNVIWRCQRRIILRHTHSTP